MALLAQNDVRANEESAEGASGTARSQRPLTSIIRDGRRLPVTPLLAARILAECFYDPQKNREGNNKSRNHVKLIAAEMAANRWDDGRQIHFVLLDDCLRLVDGYHRIRAVIESGKTIEFVPLVDVAESKTALATRYWRNNFIEFPRSMVLAAQASGMGNLNVPQMNATLAALLIIAANFAKGSGVGTEARNKLKSPEVRLALLRQWQRYAEEYFGIINLAPHMLSKMKRAGLLAVALTTLKHQPTKAKEFWSLVAKDDGLRTGDPRKTLVRYILQTTIQGGGKGTADSTIAAALCWNAFYEGRSLTIIKAGSAVNFYIAGTPVVRKFLQRKD